MAVRKIRVGLLKGVRINQGSNYVVRNTQEVFSSLPDLNCQVAATDFSHSQITGIAMRHFSTSQKFLKAVFVTRAFVYPLSL